MYEVDNGRGGIPTVYLAQPDDQNDRIQNKTAYTTGSESLLPI